MESKVPPEREAGRQAAELAPPLGVSGTAPKPKRAAARESTAIARRPPRKARRSRAPTGRRTLQQRIGERAEDIAADFLRAKGLRILERNFRRRLGELDVVAVDGDVLVIVEVRFRASTRYGGAAASVDRRKQQRLVRAAAQLLQGRDDFSHFRVRFDVICVSDTDVATPRVEWFQHAFLT